MKYPDLNLLIALNILLEEKSVAKAAERLHLSASAMSRTLMRVREAFKDPILVRAGRTLVPTPFALQIQTKTQHLVSESLAVFSNKPLDLQTLKKTFVVRASEVFIIAFEKILINQLKTMAPHVQLCFIAENDVDDDALREGRIELFIGSLQDLEPEIKAQRLFDSYLLGLARKDHPIFNTPIRVEDYAACNHLSVSRRGRARGPIDLMLADLGLKRNIPLVKPSFLSGVFSLLHSDLIMGCPNLLLPILLPELPLKTFKIPLTLKPISILQHWHPRFDNDPAHTWFRQLIKHICLTYEQKENLQTHL